jgi:CPA1 family monovalent cation:H+ antiporter
VAGIVVGNYSTRGRTSPTSSHMIVTFWEFAAFLINSAVFLLIGLRVEITALVDNLQPMLLTILAVVIARAVVVYSLRWLINRRPPQISLAWAHVMVWGGMRGAVTIALVLSLPFAVLNRNLFITMAFGYVVFSVVGQGLTLAPLLGRLGLTRKTEQELAFETKIAELALGEAAADTVETLLDENILTVGVAAGVKNRIEDWLSKHEEQLRAMLQEEPELALANQEMMLREITFVQKRTLRRLLERGIISDKTYAIFDERLNERLQGGLTEEDLFGGAEVEGEEIED